MDLFVSQLYSPSLEFILLVIALVVDVFLAVDVYLNNPKSATNRLFSVLTVCTMLWLTTTYVAQIPSLLSYTLFIHRFGIFIAAPMSAALLLFAHTMPADKIQLSARWFWATIAGTVAMMAINISPYAFTSVVITNGSSDPQPGLGLVPFALLSTVFSALAVYWLLRKYRRSTGDERRVFATVLAGILIMLAFIIATVLVPIIFTGSIAFLVFTPLYVLIFLGMTAYAISAYQLFHIKVLVTQALTLVLALVLFARIFGEPQLSGQVIDGLILVAVVIFGYFLVRSVRAEVEERERAEALARELAVINERQETLIHFISHEVKGFLTKDQAAFAALAEGDFGALPEALRPFVARALAETRTGVASVMDILKASNQKKGTVDYKKESFDLLPLVSRIVENARPTAEAKGVKLTFATRGNSFTMTGDPGELGDHVVGNLVDNAIAYTPAGTIEVSLERSGSKIIFSVKDSGVGISAEDKARLFTEGGHGKESQKVNVHSTGYGLFIAKNVVEAHGGTIRAQSAGAGRGSTFIVELPA